MFPAATFLKTADKTGLTLSSTKEQDQQTFQTDITGIVVPDFLTGKKFVMAFPVLLKCNSSPDKHVFLYLFPDCLCIIIHFSAYPTTTRARVLCLFAQVCKRKNPISEPRLDLAVTLVTSRYEHNTLPVNSEQ